MRSIFAEKKIRASVSPSRFLNTREEKEVEIAYLGVSHLSGEIRSIKKGANSWNTQERNRKIESIGKGKVAKRRANLAMEIEFQRRKFSGDSLCYYTCATQHRERTFAKHHEL